jgi:hypothetical protein
MSELTRAQAYKYGFLLGCAERGLSPGEARTEAARLLGRAKQAGMEDYVGPMLLGLPAALTLGAGGLGYFGGHSAGRSLRYLTDQDVSAEELQKRELLDTYRTYADEAASRDQAAKRRLRLRSLAELKPKPAPALPASEA